MMQTHVRLRTRAALTSAVILFAPSLAWSQPEPEPDDFGGDEVELDDTPMPTADLESPAGADENPDAPRDYNQARVTATPATPMVKQPRQYPLALAQRPITLWAGMSELEVTAPVLVDPFAASVTLEADYGITDRAQLGLRYNPGTLTEDDFVTGKAVAVDGLYLLTDFLAAQLSVPLYLDPLAIGVTFGAPLRFRFGNWALIGGHDLLSVKLVKFIPELDDAARNETMASQEESGTLLPDYALRLLGGVIYQLRANLALVGEIGVETFDENEEDELVPLSARLVYSSSNQLDLAAQLGARDLGDVGDTFGLTLVVTLRL